MAFDNVLLPTPKLIHGIQKRVINPIAILSNGNKEYRIQKNSQEKYSWSIPARNMEVADKIEIYKFWMQRDRGLDSFKFQDPDYPEFVNAPLSFIAGTQWKHAVPLDSSTPGSHPVHSFDSNAVVKVNGVVTSGVTFGHTSGGVPYISVPGSVSTDVITISGKCYLSARFGSDIGFSIIGLNTDNTPSFVQMNDITIDEVFEY